MLPHLLTLIILKIIAECGCVGEDNYSLPVESPHRITINRGLKVQIYPENITAASSFLIFQVHSHYHNVTVSLTSEFTIATSKNGTDVGLVSLLTPADNKPNWFLYQNSTDNLTVTCEINVGYEKDPIPGGCNLEFNLLLDANLLVKYSADTTTIEYQFAVTPINNSLAALPAGTAPCENTKLQSKLSYHLYAHYIKGGDFSEVAYFYAIEDMMKPADMMQNGWKLVSTSYADSGKPEWTVTSYKGQGVIYNVMVKMEEEGQSSTMAYIPVTTYACDLTDLDKNCKEIDIQWYIVAVIAGILGLFLCIFGHKYFVAGNFILAFLAYCVVIYILFTKFAAVSEVVTLVLTLILSLVGAALWLSVWYCCGVAPLSVLLSGFTAGYLVSSIIFYTPFGNLSYWTNDFNYGMTFTCGVMVLPVILLAFTKTLNIVSCSFVGSYLMIMTVDVFLHSGIKYILINSLRHATNEEYFNNVIITSPFTVTEIILTSTWGVLFIVSTIIQFLIARGKPDFPESPRKLRSQKRHENGNGPVPWRQRIPDDRDDDERTPLIRDGVMQRSGYVNDHGSVNTDTGTERHNVRQGSNGTEGHNVRDGSNGTEGHYVRDGSNRNEPK